MFAVIYRFKLKPEQERLYQQCWRIVAQYFIAQRGALGSCLHKGDDGLWVAYSRWPDQATRDRSWSAEGAPNIDYPKKVSDALLQMQVIKQENQDLEQYEEIKLEVVDDLIFM